VAGIVLLAVLYGCLLSRFTYWCSRFRSSLGPILKGAVIAGTFAIIRGGDLAGTVAFVGMSYWPLAFFFYRYRKFASARLLLETKVKAAGAATPQPLSARAMRSIRRRLSRAGRPAVPAPGRREPQMNTDEHSAS
jgi:hypothetical protein